MKLKIKKQKEIKNRTYKYTPKYIIVTYFDTKLSMFGLALSTTKEGAKGPKKSLKGPEGPKGPQALSKRQKEGRGVWSPY